MSYLKFAGRKFKSIRNAAHRRWSEKLISGLEYGEEITTYDLICPLRYDILIRANFISLLSQNDFPSASNLDKLLEHPAARAYQTWLKE